MHTQTSKLDKGLEYDMFRAALTRRKRDPIQAVIDELERQGEDPSEYTLKQLKGLYKEGFVGNVEL